MPLFNKPQRNALFLAIQDEGFDPGDFYVEHTNDLWKLSHRDWRDWFAVERVSDPHESINELQVTDQIGDAEPQTTRSDGFNAIPSVLNIWLTASKANHETPDLWAELSKAPITELAEGQENTPFSESEQQRIAETAADVLAQARESYKLPERELRLLEAKLDYLVEAARHTRRIDWLNVAVGAVGGAFAGGVLTPDVVHKVLGALGAGLGPLFGHPVPMLGP